MIYVFIKIPFESEIEFKTNISEITKMSLEHDFNVNDTSVLGNFYVSGEYRVHEVSINKEPFKYTLPFTVELRDDIISDSLEFNIEDFSYEVVDNKILKVFIEYSIEAEVQKSEELFERVNEEVLESELSYIDNFLDNVALKEEKEIIETEVLEDNIEEEKEKTENHEIEEKNKATFMEEDKKEKVKIKKEEIKEIREESEEKDERISKEEEKTVMETIKNSDDTFVTYHIHIVKESENIESICALYGVTSSLIGEYNNLENLATGDKILIPKTDE